MKEIKLTQGKVTLVDDSYYEWLNSFKWYAVKGTRTFYAARNVYVGGRQKMCGMHQVIMGSSLDGLVPDHVDGDGLNNQCYNLRMCTRKQNCANSTKHMTDTTSKFKGVHWCKRDKRWIAQININHKKVRIGCFLDETEAAMAYNKKALDVFGEYAKINILK